MDKTLKIVTGYQLPPVDLSPSANEYLRGQVNNLHLAARRGRLRALLTLQHARQRVDAWCAEQIGRPLVSGDKRFVASSAAFAVSVCSGSVLLMVPVLAWFGVELRGVLRREQKGGAA